MLILKWSVFLSFVVGTIFRTIGEIKDTKTFTPFTIASIVCYSIGLVICIIGLICSLN